MLNKYRVTWRTKSGEKKRLNVFATSAHYAALMLMACHEEVDLILDVKLIEQF